MVTTIETVKNETCAQHCCHPDHLHDLEDEEKKFDTTVMVVTLPLDLGMGDPMHGVDNCEKKIEDPKDTKLCQSLKEQVTEKDVAYGWLVVFASFMLQVVADGLTYTFSLFYVKIGQEFPDVHKGQMSMTLSILAGFTHGMGPVASMLVNKFGLKAVSILGSSLAAAGFALSYFAPNVSTMYATVGVLGGIGFCFMYLPAMVSVPQHFEKKLSLAMGIACCGTGAGTLFFEWTNGIALKHLEWRQVLLINGGVVAMTILCALPHKSIVDHNNKKDGDSTTVVSVVMDPENCCPPSSEKAPKSSSSSPGAIDWSLLQNVQFLLFSFADILLCTGSFIPYIYLPEVEQKMSNTSSTSVLGFIGGGTIIGRLILGYISDKAFINSRYLALTVSGIGGLTTAACPHLHSVALLRTYAAIYGTCLGTFVSLRPVVLVDLFGLDKLTSAFGFVMCMHASGMAIGPVIAGYLYEYFGKRAFMGFYFAGFAMTSNAVLLMTLPLVKHFRLCSKKEKDDPEMTKEF